MTPCSGCYSGERAILGAKTPAGENRSYCTTREALLRCIREYCCIPDQGEACAGTGVDGAAMQHVGALPEYHIDWTSTRPQ